MKTILWTLVFVMTWLVSYWFLNSVLDISELWSGIGASIVLTICTLEAVYSEEKEK